MKKYGAILVACVLGLFLGTSVMAQTFKIMTEEYPPFNYSDGGKLSGLAVEVMQAMVKKLGHPEDIEMLPWARAYGLIQ